MIKVGVERRWQRLAASNERPTSSAAVAVVLLVRRLRLDHPLDNLLNVSNLNQDILRLEVRVDDAALPVQVIQAEQNLLGDLLDKRHGDAAMIPPLDEAQQVLAQHLKHHAHVGSVGAFVFE